MSDAEDTFEAERILMMPLLQENAVCSPPVSALHRVRLAPAAAHLWRVVDADGRVIGHLEAVGDAPGGRWAAKRFHAASRAFRDLGEFWSADDAVETLIFAR